jgi:enamine deaminase RidA (YjgF/YER057c/UK114 family)
VTDRQAYAPGIRIAPQLDLLLFSGISAYPPDVDPWNPGGFKVPAVPEERGAMATDNLDRLLTAAGATWEHIVFNVSYTAPGGGGMNLRARMGSWSPCSTSLRVVDTGIPGVNTLNQITAVAPRKAIAKSSYVPGIEPILHRPGVTLKDLPQAPGIRISSDVDLVYFPGVTAYPLDVDPWSPGSFIPPADLAAQEKLIESNVDKLLASAGIGWSHVVMLAVTGEVKGLNTLRGHFGDWRPCRTTRAVSTGIPGARLLCEITAVAPRKA